MKSKLLWALRKLAILLRLAIVQTKYISYFSKYLSHKYFQYAKLFCSYKFTHKSLTKIYCNAQNEKNLFSNTGALIPRQFDSENSSVFVFSRRTAVQQTPAVVNAQNSHETKVFCIFEVNIYKYKITLEERETEFK